MDVPDKKIQHDIEVISRFIEIYCTRNHGGRSRVRVSGSGKVSLYLKGITLSLCDECGKLLLHAATKRILCPYDPKPQCKKCATHCYAKGYREKIREVMRFSGMHLVKRGRIDLIKKYFF